MLLSFTYSQSFTLAPSFNINNAYSGLGQWIAGIAGIVTILLAIVAVASKHPGWAGLLILFAIIVVVIVGYVSGTKGPACAPTWIDGQSYANGAEVSAALTNGQMANWTSNIPANAGTNPSGSSGTWTFVANCVP
jgi:hypothetical protein